MAAAATEDLHYRRSIHTCVMDYEEGWQDLVVAMNQSTNTILLQQQQEQQQQDKPQQLSCEWGGKCDITKPLPQTLPLDVNGSTMSSTNAACLSQIQQANLIICQYCVAENAKLLLQSDYVFFEHMMQQAADGTLFVFTETTPRLWPDFCDLFQRYNNSCDQETTATSCSLQVSFNQNGKQMFVIKSSSCTTNINQHVADDLAAESLFMTLQDAAMVERFVDIAGCHQRKIQSGW
eukprot:CAMPEP_0168813024 /NCGR_PEP_ID=MMETSP0726-20121227/4945_1 /TAXON_ID=265536 /ORGANISM="Amphiprora sp., Strain CCMP467" /LENGTH=234 /DNA_ID=CAMNT_0008865141 /DNA_START=10 /DNA_END=711 /DNA_ORIENTATION=-